jgi:hypothetical protein
LGVEEAVENPAKKLLQGLALLWAEACQHLVLDLRAAFLGLQDGGASGFGDLHEVAAAIAGITAPD